MNEGTVLMDTPVWLWLAQGNDRLLDTPGFGAIQKARESKGILISFISVWEVGFLAARGRILLRQDYRRWVERALQGLEAKLQPMTVGVALEASALPGEFHSDPVDRILVATARELNVPIITADPRILAYAKSGQVRAIEV